MSDIVKSEPTTGMVSRNTYSFESLEKMAGVLAKSKMFGAWDTQDKVLALLLISQTEGGNPCVAVQRYFPITNKQGQTSTGKWARAMLIDFQEVGGELEWLITNAQEAKGLFTMPNRKPFTFGYTWAQAVRAQLTGKTNWSQHPDDMLRNTVIAKGLRAYHPASTSFMYSESEGIESFNDNIGNGNKSPAPQIFGKAKKEEKVVDVTVIQDNNVDPNFAVPIPSNKIPETPIAYGIGRKRGN
jgi:hypothetical protein